MSLDDEKRTVACLRRERGMTLQQIANELGKSIYWVNARLNSDYEPKRLRKTSADEISPPEELNSLVDPSLIAEVEAVRQMRSEGMTFQEIAGKLNRSVYWVHSRLRKGYRPSYTRAERLFQEGRVIPWLLSQGHRIIGQCVRCGEPLYPQEADVVSICEDIHYITEVKVTVVHHEFQTAIGQLILHRCAAQDGSGIRLQIALPHEIRPARLSDELLSCIRIQSGITVAFVP